MRTVLLVALLLADSASGLKVKKPEDDDGVDRLLQAKVKPMR